MSKAINSVDSGFKYTKEGMKEGKVQEMNIIFILPVKNNK